MSVYQSAVSELRRAILTHALVVRKAQLATGYSEHQRAAEQRRRASRKLRAAILRYNAAAAALPTPREPLTWAVVTQNSFLANL
ncbi:hypothetical protein DFH06DRAFT_1352012 [Mycena polygramma]|nr:hypothetical protein DFH06DRAFT_1352012 [Mycena polygramma]